MAEYRWRFYGYHNSIQSAGAQSLPKLHNRQVDGQKTVHEERKTDSGGLVKGRALRPEPDPGTARNKNKH